MKISFSRAENPSSPRKHCETCQCENQSEFFQWRKERKFNGGVNQPSGSQFQSRMREFRGPISRHGESRISGEKICWYRSVSPKRPNIKIKISTPMNPNLIPADGPKLERSRVQSHYRFKSQMPRSQLTPLKLSESMSTQVSPSSPKKNLFSGQKNSTSFIYTEGSETERDRLRWSNHNGFIRNTGSPNGFYNS